MTTNDSNLDAAERWGSQAVEALRNLTDALPNPDSWKRKPVWYDALLEARGVVFEDSKPPRRGINWRNRTHRAEQAIIRTYSKALSWAEWRDAKDADEWFEEISKDLRAVIQEWQREDAQADRQDN